ncbi:hypothetical protein ACFL1P_00875 [Patescibacteria group bacterium]
MADDILNQQKTEEKIQETPPVVPPAGTPPSDPSTKLPEPPATPSPTSWVPGNATPTTDQPATPTTDAGNGNQPPQTPPDNQSSGLSSTLKSLNPKKGLMLGGLLFLLLTFPIAFYFITQSGTIADIRNRAAYPDEECAGGVQIGEFACADSSTCVQCLAANTGGNPYDYAAFSAAVANSSCAGLSCENALQDDCGYCGGTPGKNCIGTWTGPSNDYCSAVPYCECDGEEGYCGDGICQDTVNGCNTCPEDCGECSGECANVGENCDTLSNPCCSGENLVCQSPAGGGQNVCQDTGEGDLCPDGGECTGVIAFTCDQLTASGECLENPQDFTLAEWGDAISYAGGCGQVDQVCIGGSNARNLCGDDLIINDNCGTSSNTNTPTPTTPGNTNTNTPTATPTCIEMPEDCYPLDPNGPDCTVPPEGFCPLSPTVTPTPIEGQCDNILVYRDGQVIDPNTLHPGDVVTIAIVGVNATKARIRVNGGDYLETEVTNENDEYILEYTIPDDGTVQFIVEADVFVAGAWM